MVNNNIQENKINYLNEIRFINEDFYYKIICLLR